LADPRTRAVVPTAARRRERIRARFAGLRLLHLRRRLCRHQQPRRRRWRDLHRRDDAGRELDAKLVGTDPRTDLAVLKVDPDGQRKFTYVDFADDAKIRVGDWVVAVGNPFGLGGTVTAGIVSARGRDIGAGPYDDFLQIDAAVNRGNSGGPAFNLNGEVVGINTAIFSPSGGNVGIAFAIPASTAKRGDART
jgi:S1-C subfamily serine protease